MSLNSITVGSPSNRTESTVYINTAAFPCNTSADCWIWLPDTETCIFVYSGIIVAIVFLSVGSTICFFTMCMRASVTLHDSMFASVTHATMQFFNNNPSGNLRMLR